MKPCAAGHTERQQWCAHCEIAALKELLEKPFSHADTVWLHSFIKCSAFGPPPEEIERAHNVLHSLVNKAAEWERRANEAEAREVQRIDDSRDLLD